MTILGRRACRGCGCTENNACVVDGVPCRWVLLDVGVPTGVCSVCAEELRWQPQLLICVGLDDEQPRAAGDVR
jgi:hypothetical protein